MVDLDVVDGPEQNSWSVNLTVETPVSSMSLTLGVIRLEKYQASSGRKTGRSTMRFVVTPTGMPVATSSHYTRRRAVDALIEYSKTERSKSEP